MEYLAGAFDEERETGLEVAADRVDFGVGG